MTSSVKTGLAVLVIIIAGGLVWYFASQPKSVEETPAGNTEATSTTSVSVLPTPATDTSDTAVQTDLGAVDAQISGFAGDTANVSQSLSDKPLQ